MAALANLPATHGCGAAARPAARSATCRLPSSLGISGRVVAASPFRPAPRARRLAVAPRAAIVDPMTKIEFDEVQDGLTCLGAGVREKSFGPMNVAVYSVALYVDAAAAAGAGLQDLGSGNFTKRLVVKMARAVDGPTFWEALDEAIYPRIGRFSSDDAFAFGASQLMAQGGADNAAFLSALGDALGNATGVGLGSMDEATEVAGQKEDRARRLSDELGRVLSQVDLEAGSVLTLTASPGGALTVEVGGGSEVFESPELAQAVFDVYIGDDPVSPQAYQAFMAGATQCLSA